MASSTNYLDEPPSTQTQPAASTSSSIFSYPVRSAVSGVFRRLSSETFLSRSSNTTQAQSPRGRPARQDSYDEFQDFQEGNLIDLSDNEESSTRPPGNLSASNLRQTPTKSSASSPAPPRSTQSHLQPSSGTTFEPIRRAVTPPPFQPPPLTSLTLNGTTPDSQILTKLLAEEIRLLMPARLQLVDSWNLAFSLERDGSSLSTLYDKCEAYNGKRGGFVLVVKDGTGDVFGAYLSDPPHPSKGHYYGTGECFLWRCAVLRTGASISLGSLPPPPSADTTHATRSTTLGSPTSSFSTGTSGNQLQVPTPGLFGNGTSGDSTPERIRFMAFPYSGINDYMIFCEHSFLSIGGGDGHYGLWLDSSLENGVSDSCPTFGNEPLSAEGKKFEVLDVEIWYLGA